jgi:hypothetical protein
MTIAKSRRFRFSHRTGFISVSTDRDGSLATREIEIELGIEEKASWREVVRANILDENTTVGTCQERDINFVDQGEM